MGLLKKELSDWYKIDKPVLVAEIGIAKITATVKDRPFKMWNKFPSSSRDFSFLIDKTIKYEKLINSIEDNKPDSLESFELFDYYRGKGIPEDKISLSMSFSYRAKSKTLTNEEINNMHERLVQQLKTKLNLVQR
jgi:phenylalanyl-tRNA synthetase beta chain